MARHQSSEAISLEVGGEFFANAVATYPDCVRILDLDGRVEFMNPRGLALFEIDDFELNRGRYWPDLWPEASRSRVLEALQAAISGQTGAFQAYCPTVKGSPRWWDTVVFPIYMAGETRPARLLARSRDVTKERETQSLLNTIVQNIPDILVAKVAATGRIVLANRAAEEALGLGQDELIGSTDRDLFPLAQAAVFESEDVRAFESGEVQTFEGVLKTAVGETRRFRTKKIGLLDETGVGHIVAIAEDVTEQGAAAEALQVALRNAEAASEAKSAFLATMSHEIRTPLNGVLGMVQAMSADELTPTQRGRLEVIRQSGETLLAILNDILDLSRIEAGMFELELAEFDLGELVQGASANFASLAEQKGVSFAVTVEPSAQAVFHADATCLRRLLFNLISNAIKFTDCGHVHVRAAYTEPILTLEVADSGIGIAPDFMSQLFNEFTQGDASHTRRFGGSGLGLAICRELVERMGGEIKVASVVGEGTVFTLAIPLVRASHIGHDGRAPAPGDASARAAAAVRILVAEDNQVNQLVIRTLLEQAGTAPFLVSDGAAAVSAWEDEHWDVILMDIQMPVMDGLSATRAIRACEATNGRRRTPILAVTANAMKHHEAEYRAAGVDAIVPKPVRVDQLFEALSQALGQQAS